MKQIKLFVLMVIMALSLSIGAQTVEVTPTNGKFKTEQQATKTSTLTTYVDKEGRRVWKSVNGKFFVVRLSKNGTYYKQYVTITKL